MNPWYIHIIEILVVLILFTGVIVCTVTIMKSKKKQEKRNTKKVLLLLKFILLIGMAVFMLSHKTYYKYNDWTILSNNINAVYGKYGEFDVRNINQDKAERNEFMKVLITGASSGIGREMARILASNCEQLVLVGRNTQQLEQLKKELSANATLQVMTVSTDLSVTENCVRLHEAYPDVDLLINNAGFGDFGTFTETSLDKEMQMIDTNIKALHILMKLYLVDMVKKDHGQILNVASIAGFMPGPLMGTYYATKAYVVRLSEAVRKELKQKKSKVRISILCPGPVRTNFEKTANIKFNFGGKDVRKVAKYALDHLNQFYIVPVFTVRASRVFLKILPTSWIAAIIYRVQSRRSR